MCYFQVIRKEWGKGQKAWKGLEGAGKVMGGCKRESGRFRRAREGQRAGKGRGRLRGRPCKGSRGQVVYCMGMGKPAGFATGIASDTGTGMDSWTHQLSLKPWIIQNGQVLYFKHNLAQYLTILDDPGLKMRGKWVLYQWVQWVQVQLKIPRGYLCNTLRTGGL
jgi:hypothetical protein